MKKKTMKWQSKLIFAALLGFFAVNCGGIDGKSTPDTPDDELLSIGALYVEYYKDLDSTKTNIPITVVDPNSDVEEETTRLQAPKKKDPLTGKDEVVFIPENPEYVYDAEGNPVAISDLSDYDWSENPAGYTGFTVTAKFEMPEFITLLDYNGVPTESSVPAPKESVSIIDNESKTTTYPWVAWKTLTGSVAPEPNETLDVVEDARLARAMVKVSEEGVFPPEYLLKVYALYQDSFSIDEQLKIAAQKQREAEAKLKIATALRYDDEKLVGKTTDIDANDKDKDLLDQLQTAYNKLNELSKGTQSTVTADLGNGATETVTVINYDNASIVYYTDLITELMTQLAGRGDVSTQTIPNTITLAVDYEYGAIYGPDPNDSSKTIITNPDEVTVKRAYSVTITSKGIYEIELDGASGGHTWSKSDTTYTGGKGAHVKARVALDAGNVIRIYLGGEGGGTAVFDQSTSKFSKITSGLVNGVTVSGDAYYQNYTKPGGWNGGGSGGSSRGGNYASGAAGGGATDVRIVTSTGLRTGQVVALEAITEVNNHAYTFFGEKAIDPSIHASQEPEDTEPVPGDTRILVAGGGGGSAQRHQHDEDTNNKWPALKGGVGGRPAATDYYEKPDGTNSNDKANIPIRGKDPTFDNSGSGVYFSAGNLWYYCLPPPGLNKPIEATGDITGTDYWQGQNGRNAYGISQGKYEGSGGGGGGWVGGATMIQNSGGTSSGGGGSSFFASGKIGGISATDQIANDNSLSDAEKVTAAINQVYGEGRATITFISVN